MASLFVTFNFFSGINENKKNVIKEDELKFLPVIARLDDDFAEENVTQDLEKKK